MKKDILVFKKRVYDERLFTLDVSKKLRAGDSVTTFSSVTSKKVIDDDETENLVVNRDTTPIRDDTVLAFTCEGGSAGASYIVALRYVSDTETG